MKTNSAKETSQIFVFTGAVMSWFAVILQLYLIIIHRVTDLPETLIRFFSFYTILTNLIVAIAFTYRLVKDEQHNDRFSSPGTTTAIGLYITVVGLVYNLVLRSQWNPTGLQRLADELLHVVIPIFYVFCWWRFFRKDGVQWNSIPKWLIYPAVYLILILIRGAYSNYYPYPFLNVAKLGYEAALLNCGGVLILFLIISFLFVGIGKSLTAKSAAL